MAKSRFEYVRNYELPDSLIPNTFIVVRVDGKGFHKFSDEHSFTKPNDKRALDLMNAAAQAVLEEYKDVVMAFGESDEYSFLLRRETKLYNRRRSKINSSVVSLFTSAYVFYWPQFFPETALRYPPTFDGRAVVYPTAREVRDYFSWRQADTHINNLYNTAFWALVHDGCSTAESHKILQGTTSKDKNEILFKRFEINYNNLPEVFRKGSICVRKPSEIQTEEHDRSTTLNGVTLAVGLPTTDRPAKGKQNKQYLGTDGKAIVLHVDIIKDEFWVARPWLVI
ncbi:hypothetical protein IAR50_000351 [Cryptococcus sp. DSM 104548]